MVSPSEFGEWHERTRDSHKAHAPGLSRLFPDWTYSFCRAAGSPTLTGVKVLAKVLLLQMSESSWERHRFWEPPQIPPLKIGSRHD